MQVLPMHPIADAVGISASRELRDPDRDLKSVEAGTVGEDLAHAASEVSVLKLRHRRARMGGLGEGETLADKIYRVAPVQCPLNPEARSRRDWQEAPL